MKYRIIDCKKRNKQSLSTITPLLKDTGRSNTIEISKWHNWDTSFWIKIIAYENSIIVDSGVIEKIAEEIKKIKKRAKRKINYKDIKREAVMGKIPNPDC